jgi:protein phosphatase 1 regulatory subunit 7
LDVSFNQIRLIENVDKLTCLSEFYIANNKLTDIPLEISTIKQITLLELGANRLREITNLDSLTNLTSLWIGKNKITEIKGLDKLVNLRKLSLQVRNIKSQRREKKKKHEKGKRSENKKQKQTLEQSNNAN